MKRKYALQPYTHGWWQCRRGLRRKINAITGMSPKKLIIDIRQYYY